MAITVLIPTTLRSFTNHRSELELEGSTAGEVIRSLADEYPETKKALFDDSGDLRSFINVFVNGENIKALQGNETPVKTGDEIMLIPAIAGGAPLAQYLAAAGVGKLGLIDFDEVDETNLQRQVIHGTRDIGRPKVASAKDSIRQINPLVKVETYNYMLTAENALDIISEYDVVADASDNYQCRYLVNDACVLLGKPDVFGAMYQFEGQASVYYAKEGPCYRCMYPSPPPAGLVPSCATGGVMGALPGIIGTIQANEVIKLIVGGGETLVGRC